MRAALLCMAERGVTSLTLLQVGAINDALREMAARRAHSPVIDGLLPATLPTPFQLAQGVWHVQHRVVFRNKTFGLSAHAVRDNWRARLLRPRPIRLPFLLMEGSVMPQDLSGLLQPPAALRRHVMGTHHEGMQPIYDLQILAARAPGELALLRQELLALVEGRHPRGAWLRDLCVYERYHEALLPLVDMAIAEAFERSDDEDLDFFAFMRFCARQPPSLDALGALAKAGQWHIERGAAI